MNHFLDCRFFIVHFVFCLLSFTSSAIVIDSAKVEKHEFSKAGWEQITKDIDYSKEQVSPSPSSKSSGGFHIPISAGAAKIILFVLVSALLVFLLLRVFAGNIFVKDKAIKENTAWSETEEVEDIHLSDLDKIYRDAIAARNYRLAIRACYLMAIRELSEQHLISWKKEKTNREYVFEMMNHAAINQFREITYLFERIWYGEAELNEKNFSALNPRFNSFVSELRNQKAHTFSAPSSD